MPVLLVNRLSVENPTGMVSFWHQESNGTEAAPPGAIWKSAGHLTGPSQPIRRCLRYEAINFDSVTFAVMGPEVKNSDFIHVFF